METKHTQGPWEIYYSGSSQHYSAVRITSAEGHDVAALIIPNGKNAERSAANLALIAAAPDLLAALRAFAVAYHDADCLSDPELGAAAHFAWGVIAKATGDAGK